MQLTNLADQKVETSSILSSAKGRGKGIIRFITANPKIAFGLGIVIFFALVAIAAPLLTTYNPDKSITMQASLPPSSTHILGTTSLGQDEFAQLVYGARVSLTIGFVAAFGSTLLQVLFGLVAGYMSGLVDEVLSLITNVFLVLPGLPLTIVLASLASAGNVAHNEVIIALVLLFTSWAYGARVLRAQTLSIKEREFIAASRSSGESTWRIIFAEILPNEVALVTSTFIGTFVYAVGAEVALEFLGLGDVAHASWGVMLFWAQENGSLIGGEWWQFVPVGLCIALLCSSLAFINFGIDELANPNLRSEKLPKTLNAPKAARAAAEKESVAV